MPACHAGGRGFEPLLSRHLRCWHGSTVEQLTCNQQVVGSIPIASSILNEATNIWLLGQAVKTPPFHGGNRGSIPLGVTILNIYFITLGA